MLLDISLKSDCNRLPMTSDGLELHKAELRDKNPKLVVQIEFMIKSQVTLKGKTRP